MHLQEASLPTAKPRITITLSDEQHALLAALSELQGVSMSSIVVDLLETTFPVLDRLVSVLRNAAGAPQAVLDEIKRSCQSAEDDVLGLQSGALRQLDLIVQASSVPVVGGDALAAPPASGTGAKRVAKSEGPPTSNRGVRITSPQPKFGTNPPMKKHQKNGRAEK